MPRSRITVLSLLAALFFLPAVSAQQQPRQSEPPQQPGSAVAPSPRSPAVVPERSGATIYQIPVTGVIELGIAPFIKRSIHEAERAGARAIVLNINTLGGRVDAALQIVDAVGAATVPVYAFINPRAISAGALIAMAADSVFMVPDALFGASTVVGSEGEKVSEKAQSVMRAQYRALAERRGLDPKIGEAMVDESIGVPGLADKGKLVTLTSHEAARVGYAIEVADFNMMLTQAGIATPDIVTTQVNWAERLVRFFTNPIVAALLLPIGMLGILTEIKTPTFGAAGAVGALAIGLFFGSHFLVGLAGWEEVVLLAAGVILVGLEIFIIPGFGIAGILGAASIGVAVFLALLGDVSTSADVSRALGIVALTLIVLIVAIVWLVRYLPTRKGSTGVFLTTATSREGGYISGVTRADLLDAEGVTLTDLRPTGTALFKDERVDVVSEAGFLPKGIRIRVTQVEPYRTVVLPATPPDIL